jgi:tetratricopeptide (TPR) repeat protein
MTEELITNLAKISELRVISRTSVMRFKGDPSQSLPAIAKALNVDAVVEGSAFRAGDSVRVTVQLIDAHSDAHLWAQTYERDSHDVLALQDDLSSAIAREINVELTPVEKSRFRDAHAVKPEAYEAYLRGRYALGKWTAEGRSRAKESFEKAIALDPGFALGYSGLADYYWQAAEWDLPQLVAMPKAREFALKALKLDNSLAEAYTALGAVDCFFDYDLAASERDLLRAISVNPG